MLQAACGVGSDGADPEPSSAELSQPDSSMPLPSGAPSGSNEAPTPATVAPSATGRGDARPEAPPLDLPVADSEAPDATLPPAANFCRPAVTGAVAAFPGAEGFGAFAKGGRDGDVYHVTELAPSGPGSLAYGIETMPAAGRTIVFDVSGYANISGTLRVTKPRLTIAGQTAPGDGFGLKNGTFLLSAGDVIIRHVRFRNGRSGDSIDMDSRAVNFIWDHVDVLFSHDENMSSFGTPPENMTFQYSVNAWGLETHSAGGLWDQGRATSHHSLWAHNHTRNPKARAALLDWVNNVTFDWDIGFIMGDSETPAAWRANVRGSYFVSTTPKGAALEGAKLDRRGAPNFHLFMDGSLLDGNGNAVLDVTKQDYAAASGAFARLSAPVPLTADYLPASDTNPIIGVPVTTDDALTAYKKVVSSAGPLRLDVSSARPLRDEVSALLIDDLVNQRRRRLTYQQIAVTGIASDGFGALISESAPADSDRDGMPDEWETAVGLNPGVDDHAERVPDCTFAYVPGNAGYTWLEDYLQYLALPHGEVEGDLDNEVAGARSSIDVDMTRFTSGLLPGAEFKILTAVNGTAAVLEGGRFARFHPASNFVGRAGFTFAGTDRDGSTIASDVAILVVAP